MAQGGAGKRGVSELLGAASAPIKTILRGRYSVIFVTR